MDSQNETEKGQKETDTGTMVRNTYSEETTNKANEEFEYLQNLFRGWSRSDLIQFSILIVGAAYCVVTFAMWYAMQSANKIADRNFRRDERAWITATLKPFQWAVDSPVLFPGEMINTGKTPASNAEMLATATVLGKDEIPEFTYTRGTGHPFVTAYSKAFFPNTPAVEFEIPAFKKGTTQGENIVLTKDLLSRINNGEYFIVVHGQITYSDIFGISHWFHFCNSLPAYTVRSGEQEPALVTACEQRNRMDSNE